MFWRAPTTVGPEQQNNCNDATQLRVLNKTLWRQITPKIKLKIFKCLFSLIKKNI